MKKVLFVIAACVLVFNLSAKEALKEKKKQAISALLEKQVSAWNDGDLERYMETYWKSEDLVFVGSHGPTYGWQATLDGYKKGYPDKKTMGHLDFKILDISKIDKNTVFVIGRFELTREIGDVAGHFTLVIQKKDGAWRIISDHSSAAAG